MGDEMKPDAWIIESKAGIWLTTKSEVVAKHVGKPNTIVTEYFSKKDQNVIIRKAFICPACEGVDADSPVSQCHCMENDSNTFIEGVISYSMVKK